MAQITVLLSALMLCSQIPLQAQFRGVKTVATDIKSADLHGNFGAGRFGKSPMSANAIEDRGRYSALNFANRWNLHLVFAKERGKLPSKGGASPQFAADRLWADVIKQESFTGNYAFSATPWLYSDDKGRFFASIGGYVITGIASAVGLCSPGRFIKPLYSGGRVRLENQSPMPSFHLARTDIK